MSSPRDGVPVKATSDRISSLAKHLKSSLNPADDLHLAKMSTDYKFAGWLAHSAEDAKGTMKWGDFEPKTWEETDVDIKITHCGICGSDLHTLRSGWVSFIASYHGYLI